jgi:hypothetical protein
MRLMIFRCGFYFYFYFYFYLGLLGLELNGDGQVAFLGTMLFK